MKINTLALSCFLGVARHESYTKAANELGLSQPSVHQYVKRLEGPNVKKGKNKKDLAEQVVADIRKFKADNQLDRLVMVWCGSTEVFLTESPAHATLAAFEKALEASDDNIPSSMIYAYAAIKEGIPYANAAPNLSADVPALMEEFARTAARPPPR